MARSYLDTAAEVYRKAASKPQKGLCCANTPMWKFPGLKIPDRMLDMNYGCGTTIHPRDLADGPSVLYVGVGGGMELLQFAYFSRNPGAVIGIEPVADMLAACRSNLEEAEELNRWFEADYVELRRGSALDLPVEDESVDVGAQNCLFNIFRHEDLQTALSEMYRVLRPNGRLVLSDPICEARIPGSLRNDERLRAMCLTGAVPLQEYVDTITSTGFGTVEIRARRPYRVLDPKTFDTPELIYIESVEICAVKSPVPEDGPCIFSGKTAIYFGSRETYSDGKGHTLLRNQPLGICDKTAELFQSMGLSDLLVTDSTYFYDGGGCC